MNVFINIFSNCHKEDVKGISQDFGAEFYFVIYFYRFKLCFWVFLDIYNGSYSVPCFLWIIFVFLKEWLVKICLIDSCKFVNKVSVIFEFLEECSYTSCFFASNELAIYNVFLFNWLQNSFCQPWFFQFFFVFDA